LPSRRHVVAYLSEFARVLAPAGQAFVQLPVLEPGLRARLWRVGRTALLPLLPRGPERSPALRGFRLSEPELERGLVAARLAPTARDVGPDAPYRWSRDLFLRLEHA
ncbi:MAG: hypothetical protein M3168_04635, partial [Actinomycetota bacterium]|nr:hypothetical protein [Actinomycetota bacterium]